MLPAWHLKEFRPSKGPWRTTQCRITTVSVLCCFAVERDIKVVRPLYSVEVTETETAKFETEISEEDVHGNWKLKGEALHQSAVSVHSRVSAAPLGHSLEPGHSYHSHVCRVF